MLLTKSFKFGSIFLGTTEVSMPRIPEQFDVEGRLVVSVKRDQPPLGDGMSSVVCSKIENGIFYFAGIRDTDVLKGGGKNFQLPGGRAKTPDHEKESPRDTALQEVYEEAGVVRMDGDRLEDIDLEPVAFVTRHNVPLRDKADQPIMIEIPTGQNDKDGKRIMRLAQKRGTIYQSVFAHSGLVQLRETTDHDAKEPRWFTLDQIVDAPDDARWSVSHIVVLVETLKLIARGLRAFCVDAQLDAQEEADKVKSPQKRLVKWDREDFYFYGAIIDAAKQSNRNYFAISDFADLGEEDNSLARFKIAGHVLNAEAILERAVDQSFAHRFLWKRDRDSNEKPNFEFEEFCGFGKRNRYFPAE